MFPNPDAPIQTPNPDPCPLSPPPWGGTAICFGFGPKSVDFRHFRPVIRAVFGFSFKFYWTIKWKRNQVISWVDHMIKSNDLFSSLYSCGTEISALNWFRNLNFVLILLLERFARPPLIPITGWCSCKVHELLRDWSAEGHCVQAVVFFFSWLWGEPLWDRASLSDVDCITFQMSRSRYFFYVFWGPFGWLQCLTENFLCRRTFAGTRPAD